MTSKHDETSHGEGIGWFGGLLIFLLLAMLGAVQSWWEERTRVNERKERQLQSKAIEEELSLVSRPSRVVIPNLTITLNSGRPTSMAVSNVGLDVLTQGVSCRNAKCENGPIHLQIPYYSIRYMTGFNNPTYDINNNPCFHVGAYPYEMKDGIFQIIRGSSVNDSAICVQSPNSYESLQQINKSYSQWQMEHPRLIKYFQQPPAEEVLFSHQNISGIYLVSNDNAPDKPVSRQTVLQSGENISIEGPGYATRGTFNGKHGVVIAQGEEGRSDATRIYFYVDNDGNLHGRTSGKGGAFQYTAKRNGPTDVRISDDIPVISPKLPSAVTALLSARNLKMPTSISKECMFDFGAEGNPFFLEGDFDGDGRPDYAISTEVNKNFGRTFVVFANGQIHELEGFDLITANKARGDLDTLDGVVNLQHDSFEGVHCEKSSVLHVYNKAIGAFDKFFTRD